MSSVQKTSPKPSLALSVALVVLLVTLWGWLHLIIFANFVAPLTYALPMLIGVWHRRRWLVWSMALASGILAAIKVAGFTDHVVASEYHGLILVSRLINISVAGAVVHIIINLRDWLEKRNLELAESNASLSEANRELAERERRIAQQNEELQSQAEELAQQNEEITSQSEEMEQQNEELRTQSEELQIANEELARREGMLQSLLEASSILDIEERALRDVCRSAVEMLGPEVVAAAVLQPSEQSLCVRTSYGIGQEQIRPTARTLAGLAIEQDHAAGLADVSQRPDLMFLQPVNGNALRSVLAAPLRMGGRNIGALEFYSSEVTAWRDDQFRMAEWVAAQCSLVLEGIRLRQELQSSESRYRSLFNSMTEGFALKRIICDAGGKPVDAEFMDVNDSFERLTGLRRSEVIGRTMRQVLLNDDPEWIQRYGRVALTGEPAHFDLFSSALGRHYEVFSYSPERGQFAVIFMDVTVRKEMERELKAAKEAAESASRAKDQFLAVLSHELRTPLTPVLLTTSLLERNAQLPEDVREDIRTIQRNVELETHLIDDLLDLTRIARGKVRFEFKSIDVHQLLRSAVNICRTGEGAPIELQLEAADSHARADAARLQQVFWNLLNNALKFTPRSGRIVVRSSNPSAGRLRIEVQDNGCGIEPAFIGRVFNAFEQGEIGVARPKGLGLGLAISKAIVDAHQGSISAHSAGRGSGATFTVEVPTATGHREDRATEPSAVGLCAGRESTDAQPTSSAAPANAGSN